MTDRVIHLGYEIVTAASVAIPLKHMAVTGQTQESGKTTTLEALVSRGGLRAVAFVTKRAEGSFVSGRRIQPYFRERADWQFVSAVLEATLRERLKFERSWIMRACKGASTLAEVHANVRDLMGKAKGLSADVYMTLDEYLKIVTPQIEQLPYTDRLTIEPGLNVVDLSAYSMELQALVIRSVLEWVYEHEHDTVTIIPEAWEFIPQQRGSPVLLAAEQLIRKGAAARNFMWLDSQDIAGVHKNVLRSVIVWILGVQRETNEVRRMLEHVPSVPKPTVAQVMQLGKGQFYACWGTRVVPVYVQPAGVSEAAAVEAARSGTVAKRAPVKAPVQEEEQMSDAERQRYENQIEILKGSNEKLRHDLAGALENLKRRDVELNAASTAARAIADLRRILLDGAVPAKSVAGPVGAAVDMDDVVSEVLKRIPTAGGATLVVQAPEKLRKEFQQREAERVLDDIRSLPTRVREAVRLLEGTEQWISLSGICTRLGYATGGGGYADFSKAMKDVVASGYVERDDKRGLHSALRKKIEADLTVYQPTDDDVEQTYQACLAALTGTAVAS